MPTSIRWLRWARRIQAISQSGLTYCRDKFDRERYQQLASLAAEITTEHVQENTISDTENLPESFLSQCGYGTPKVGLRGAVVKDGKLLLVQEKADGLWALPGGWADVGSSPVENIRREVLEEAGLEVEPIRLLGVWDTNNFGDLVDFYHCYQLLFLCRITGGTLVRDTLETHNADFFDLDDLPPLSSPRTRPSLITQIQNTILDPSYPPHIE